MLKRPDVLLLLCCIGATHALYKQWIPDTNYENRTNWNTGVVPCGRDRVAFPARGSVFVESAHSVREMVLPLHGELILASGAGFYIGGAEEPGCGSGATAQFRDSDALRWFDPALWRAAATPEELGGGPHLFAVHEESVPCEHDDVVFRASGSFRVDTSSSAASVPVHSVSVLGETFLSPADLSRYLGTPSGRMQFHGGSALAVGAGGCGDPTGCVCDNSANRDRICGGVRCPAPACASPLRPAGHCCDVCGAVVAMAFTAGFDLQSYRQRLQQRFLAQPPYRAVRLGVSKVSQPRYLLGLVRAGAKPHIRAVVLDAAGGLAAQRLAGELLEDVRSHGSSIGISEAELQASSGGGGGGPAASVGGAAAGAVFGVLALAALIAAGVVLVRGGHVRMPSVSMPTMPWPRGAKDDGIPGDLGGPLDRGYDNPMFDKPTLLPSVPGLYGSEMSSISMTTSGVHFVNPAYDDHETDVTV